MDAADFFMAAFLFTWLGFFIIANVLFVLAALGVIHDPR